MKLMTLAFFVVFFLSGCGSSSNSQSTANRAPTAVLDPSVFAITSKIFSLDGSRSSDPDGDTLTFKWEVVSFPSSSTAVIQDQNTMNASLVPDVNGDYLVSLTVTDPNGLEDRSTILVKSRNLLGYWPFDNDGTNTVFGGGDWETQNVEFTDGVMISDGIYENASGTGQEIALVKPVSMDVNDFTLLFKYKSSNNDQEIITIGGRGLRALSTKIENGTFKVLMNPPNDTPVFEYPYYIDNSVSEWHTVYIHVNKATCLVRVEVDSLTQFDFCLPDGFSWILDHVDLNTISIQNYSKGLAFEGSVDSVALFGGHITRSELEEFISQIDE